MDFQPPAFRWVSSAERCHQQVHRNQCIGTKGKECLTETHYHFSQSDGLEAIHSQGEDAHYSLFVLLVDAHDNTFPVPSIYCLACKADVRHRQHCLSDGSIVKYWIFKVVFCNLFLTFILRFFLRLELGTP